MIQKTCWGGFFLVSPAYSAAMYDSPPIGNPEFPMIMLLINCWDLKPKVALKA